MSLTYDRITDSVTKTLGQLAADPPGTKLSTFHFALNNTVVKDNRIPPFGMRFDDAQIRNIVPVPSNQYGNPGIGGVYNYWDDILLNVPPGADLRMRADPRAPVKSARLFRISRNTSSQFPAVLSSRPKL